MRTKFKLLKVKAASFMTALFLALSFAPPAHAALTKVGPVDPVTTFPAWYQDATGLSLAPCFDNNGRCTVTMLGVPDPTLPVSFPNNIGDEGFYFVGEADAAGVLFISALEFAWANAIRAGDQVVFARIRYNSVAAPAGTYTMTHPFGTDSVVVAPGDARLRFTEDIGLAPGVFTGALQGRVGPFLRRAAGLLVHTDGNVYIGDSITPVAVAATPGLNATAFTVAGPLSGTTSLFVLEGKVVSMSVTPSSIAFPAQRPAPFSATTATVTVANLDTVNTLSVGEIVSLGTNSADFQVADVNCLAGPVAAGGACTFTVTFSGAAAGPAARTATIEVRGTLATVPKVVVQPVTGIIDAVPPSIVSTFPTTTSAPANINITLTFSEAMNPATVNATTFSVLSNGSPIAGTAPVYSDANKTASIALPAALETTLKNTVISVLTTTAMTDVVGNPLNTAATFTFTATEPDRVPPTIASLDPENNETGVPTGSVIKVTFSEPMLSTSITGSVVQVTLGGAAVEGTVTVNGSVATFTPARPLEFGTAYTITVAAGALDLTSNALASGQVINFVTNFAPTAPEIVSPSNGATEVARPVILRWKPSVDQEQDAVQYHLFLCINQAFIGSEPNCILNKSITPTTAAAKGVTYASVLSGGMLFSLFGLGFAAGLKGRKRAFMMIAVLLISALFIVSCGSGGSDTAPAPVPGSTDLTFQVDGLAANAVYFWKIEADDGKGGVSATPVRTFTTLP